MLYFINLQKFKMSNIGKQRILIPKNVIIKSNGWKLYIFGKYGKAEIIFPIHTQLIIDKNYLKLINPYIISSLYGSLQKKLRALIHGLSLQYNTYLQFVGVGRGHGGETGLHHGNESVALVEWPRHNSSLPKEQNL